MLERGARTAPEALESHDFLGIITFNPFPFVLLELQGLVTASKSHGFSQAAFILLTFSSKVNYFTQPFVVARGAWSTC